MENGEGPDPRVGLEPASVEKADFATVRRGYEPGSVRARLRKAAEELRRLNALVDSLSNRIAELEATPAEVLESRRVAEALGDEATRILESANAAARERIERAEAEHARIVGEARATAADTIEDSKQQGRDMVAEARNFRERILTDLAGKRREYQVEVEQLREMRDRLLEGLGIVREGFDGWIEELVQTGPRAAAAAERAGLRIAAQPEPSVAQMEAEIATARLAGRPLDGGPGTQTPDRDGPVAVDDTSAGADGVESPSPTDVDEGEAAAEAAGVSGLPLESSRKASGARARLYDIEAETDVDFDAEDHLLPQQAPDPPGDPSGVAPPEAGPDADAIFARLRSITTQPVGAGSEPSVTEPGATDGEPAPGPTVVAEPVDDEAAGEPVESADEVDELGDGFADEGEAGVEASDPDDLVSAARAVAVGGIARRLKRLIVDEQGDLLDGIRRNGVRAVRAAITGETSAYTRAVRVPLQDFASDIDVSIDDIDLSAAGAAILSVLVEPVRSRLSNLVEETEDVDELSRVVRTIYREVRSGRADSAAEAAFSAGWPEPIS